MQNLYKYTRYLQHAEFYDEHFTNHFVKHLNLVINEMLLYPVPKSEIYSMDFMLPFEKNIRDEYYNILYIFAKVVRVKLMWKRLLPPHTQDIKKGLTIMGEISRVTICNHIMTYYFRAYFMYEQELKSRGVGIAREAGYKDVRGYASRLLLVQRVTLHKLMYDALETDWKYESWLESIIKEKYRLDYKTYIKVDHSSQFRYEHAVSKSFHHRRMLL